MKQCELLKTTVIGKHMILERNSLKDVNEINELIFAMNAKYDRMANGVLEIIQKPWKLLRFVWIHLNYLLSSIPDMQELIFQDFLGKIPLDGYINVRDSSIITWLKVKIRGN
ncbi:hypothetical protein CsSME_00047204 [Camellia sinensis var. sinensis]